MAATSASGRSQATSAIIVEDLPERTDLPSGQTLHVSVAHHIASAILSGELRNETLLPKESDLAKQFGVSRSVIRDAMKILAAKGLVEPRRRRGTVVLGQEQWNFFDADLLSWWPAHSLDPSMSGSLMELRRAFEPVAAELAAIRRTERDVEELNRAFLRMRGAETPKAFSMADLDYHRIIFRAAGNPMFIQLGRLLEPLLSIFLKTDAVPTGDRALPGLMLHEAVAEAIEQANPALANRAMQHLIGWTELLLDARQQSATEKRETNGNNAT